MRHLFDDLCCALAQPMPRRKALKSMVGIIATGATALFMPRRAWASTPATSTAAGAGVAPTPFGSPDATLCTRGNCITTPNRPKAGPVCGSSMDVDVMPLCCPPGGSACGAGPEQPCCNTGQVCCPVATVGGKVTYNCCPAGGNPLNPGKGCCVTGCCPAGTDCCPQPAGAGGALCCPALATPGAAPGAPTGGICCDNLPFGVGQCCPLNCCCKPFPPPPAIQTGVICACPGFDDPVLHFSGGGAFLSTQTCKTVCQCNVCCACTGNATSCANTGDVGAAVLTCFNYCTYTLIQAASFTSFEGTFLGGGDFQASGSAAAMVNGVPTDISFTAAVISGVPSISVINSGTNQMLAGGTGEPGLAGLGLDIFTA